MHRADLTGERAADDLARAVLARDGRLDVCVHAVGDYLPAALEDTSRAALEHLFASNVASSFSLFAAVRPALRASRGNAVFFGCAGLEGLRARRETAAYGALKSALCVLVRSWALEEAPHGVRVNLVSPGLVPHAHASSDTLDPAKQARLPFGRPGTPDEVARAVGFLTSPDAAYTTGVDLSVAGGWML